MEIWIALAHVRPSAGRNPDADFAGLYQYVGGPAANAEGFVEIAREAFAQNGFFLVDLDQLETSHLYRDGRSNEPDVAAFIEEVEAERELTFGPGFVYENDDD